MVKCCGIIKKAALRRHFNVKRNSACRGLVQAPLSRKAVYDEFDGKGLASSHLLWLYYTKYIWHKKGKNLNSLWKNQHKRYICGLCVVFKEQFRERNRSEKVHVEKYIITRCSFYDELPILYKFCYALSSSININCICFIFYKHGYYVKLC